MRTAKSTEDLIQLVEHVSYKKTDGKLYLMGERLGWMTNTSDTFRISEPYQNIRGQRISPANKDKVQLQLLLHSTTSYTFHFINPEGRDKQLSQRDDVKNVLQKLLPKFKDKAHSELSEKKEIGSKNPKVVELYKELVSNKYVCKEEFWNMVMKNNECQKELEVKNQPRGIPNSFLSHKTKKQLDLNEEMIEDICKVFPSVRKRYNEYLTDKKLTIDINKRKDSFWKSFFQSHYFHKMLGKSVKDIFYNCAENDKIIIKQEAERIMHSKVEKPIDDNDLAVEFDRENQESLGYSGNQDASSKELIHRTNIHYYFLMNSMKNKINIDDPSNVDLDDDESPPEKKLKIVEKFEMKLFKNNDAEDEKGIKFNTDNVANYINNLSNSQVSNRSRDLTHQSIKISIDDQQNRLRQMANAIADTSSPARQPLISSNVSSTVLTNIGYKLGVEHLNNHQPELMVNSGHQTEELIQTMTRCYNEFEELLKHFWNCFPVSDDSKFDKIHRIMQSITRYYDTKIASWEHQHLNFYNLTGNFDIKPTTHLTQLYNRAKDAFSRFMENYNNAVDMSQ